MISDATVGDIRARTDIAELIGASVNLRRTGRSFSGLCPFHAEKTPSFSVSPDRGFFHCFGCGAGGDAFAFLMRMQGMSFPEAVRHLGERCGVAVGDDETDRAGREHVRMLGALNEFARRRWAACLQSAAGERARAYLAERGVTAESIDRFGIGFCPSGGSGIAAALAKKPAALAAAVEIGILRKVGDGYQDRIAGRIVFPIRDAGGTVRGFSGRAIDAGTTPKYWNSPESAIFKKSECVFGQFEASEAAAKNRRVIAVEGQFDVIALSQIGIRETVAISGTAANAPQMRQVRRLAPVATLLFDGDQSGRRAALCSFGAWLQVGGVEPNVAVLPAGDDPDSVCSRLIASQAAEFVENLISKSVPASDFAAAYLAEGRNGTIAERKKAAESVAEMLSEARDKTLVSMLQTKFSEVLGVRIDATTRTQVSFGATSQLDHADGLLLAILASNDAIRADIAGDGFQLALLDELPESARSAAQSIVGGRGVPPELSDEIATVAARLQDQNDDAAIVAECFRKLWRKSKGKRVSELGARLRECERSGDVNGLDVAVREYSAALATLGA